MSVQILIVDDERTHQKLLGTVILFVGGTSIFAKDGVEALSILETTPVDIILTDLEMPELRGEVLADRILHRNDGNGERPRIVVVSGDATPEIEAICRATGIDGFIRKPYSPNRLRESLGQVIGQGHCWPDGAPSRRLLHLEHLEKSVSHGRAAFELAACLALEDLREYVDSRDALHPSRVKLASFAQRHGFVGLYAMLEQEENAEEEWDEAVADFEQALLAAQAWLPIQEASLRMSA